MNKDREKRPSAMWAESEWPPGASETVPDPPAPQGAPRFQAVHRQQRVWRSVDVERWVEPEHVVGAIWELVGRLDLAGFAADIRAVEGRAGRARPTIPTGSSVCGFSLTARESVRRGKWSGAAPTIRLMSG